MNLDKSYKKDILQKGLLDPFWDFMDRGGKRWRVLMFIYLCESLSGKKADKYLPLAILPELIHNASLMVDDIEDNSDIRRGKPCLHKTYGEDIAINLGNLLYFIPFPILDQQANELTNSQYQQIKSLAIQEMLNIHLGQNFDIVAHKGLVDYKKLSIKDYQNIVENKTGCMVRMPMQMAGILANLKPSDIKKLGIIATNIGFTFQVVDDLLNLIGDEKKYGKEIGGDISEAKITLMIIDSLRKASKKDQQALIKILKMHTKNQKLIKQAIDIMKKYNSMDYAQKYAEKLITSSMKMLDSIKFKKNPQQLKDLLFYLIKREK